MKVLVTGKTGQIARCLAQKAVNHPGLCMIYSARSDAEIILDLGNEKQIREVVQRTKPDVIINTAAYTQVDHAEDEPDIALLINGTAAGILAEEADKIGATIIQISTDYVFDGTLDRPYKPDDKVNPISVYGKSKLAGELAVKQATDSFIIVRTAWVYSRFGQNFYTTMLRLAQERSEIHVVDDQIGNPTSAYEVAEGLLTLCNQLESGDKSLVGTTQHLVASRELSRFELAREIFARNKVDCLVRPISTSKRITKAKRPANCRLSPTIKIPNQPLFLHEIKD